MRIELRTQRVLNDGATTRALCGLALSMALAVLLAPAAGAEGALERTPSPEGAKAYIISPADGATVSSPVTVRFGLSGMGVAPAGIEKGGTGHHHLLIDTALQNWGVPIPNDEKHRHFGGGQTEVQVELAPGPHTLQLVLGDHLHIPHDPPIVSAVVSITVE